MAMSWDSMRVGKSYRLINFGEKTDFQILEVFPGPDFKVKDIHTLEIFNLSDLVRYGQGKDYELFELT